MFHLATSCPHCGARADGEAPEPVKKAPEKPRLELSPDEARSLLAASAAAQGGASVRFSDVAAELVMPAQGALELALTLVAAPLTLTTVVVLGYLLLRERRGRRDAKLAGARLLAVPSVAAMVSASAWDVPAAPYVWGGVAVSLSAWVTREVVRARRRPDPLL